MLEVLNDTDNFLLAELSAEDVDSILEEFDLTSYSFPESPTSTSFEQCDLSLGGKEPSVSTPDTLPDIQITSVPSAQSNSTSFETFATISKCLEGTQSSKTNPDTFVDIVQQALNHPSVFGQDGSQFYF